MYAQVHQTSPSREQKLIDYEMNGPNLYSVSILVRSVRCRLSPYRNTWNIDKVDNSSSIHIRRVEAKVLSRAHARARTRKEKRERKRGKKSVAPITSETVSGSTCFRYRRNAAFTWSSRPESPSWAEYPYFSWPVRSLRTSFGWTTTAWRNWPKTEITGASWISFGLSSPSS